MQPPVKQQKMVPDQYAAPKPIATDAQELLAAASEAEGLPVEWLFDRQTSDERLPS